MFSMAAPFFSFLNVLLLGFVRVSPLDYLLIFMQRDMKI